MTINRKTTSSEKVATSPLPTMGGLRLTRQRQEVYQTLLEQRDHPTAGEVYLRVRNKMPSISLATVYNCLDALVVHKLVKQVNFDREPSRFCPNFVQHGHFQDMMTGVIHDITFKEGVRLEEFLNLPEGACIDEIDIALRGRCVIPTTK
ncbi:MAG: Fur family transcriptional regulator [Akkermansia sp.]